MIAAYVAIGGSIWAAVVAHNRLGWSFFEVFSAIAAANFSTIVGLLATIQFEHEVIQKYRIRLLNSAVVSWSIFIFLSFVPFFLVIDKMRHFDTCRTLLLPIVLSAGFGVVAYGKIQDRLVAFKQKKSVLKSRTHENH